MASLVAPLVSGIPSASSGSAVFYVKGTGTLAPAYSDPAGTVVPANHTLDAYGSVVRYVTQPVDVVVLTAGGATAKTFTWQDDARVVGLESSGFNGALVGGGTGAGGFTTEALAWGELYESVGGLDARVNSGAGNIDIRVAAPGGNGTFFVGNYGAVGNNVTDDRAAIQACVSACALAGGGTIVLAAKTYLINGQITGWNDMLVLGQGATIRQGTNATLGWFLVGQRTTFVGMTFTGTSITSGNIVRTTSTEEELSPTFINCKFYCSSLDGPYFYSSSFGGMRFFGSSVRLLGSNSGVSIAGGAGLANYLFSGCKLRLGTVGPTGGAFTSIDHLWLNGCETTLEMAAGGAYVAGICNRVTITGGSIINKGTSGTSGIVQGSSASTLSLTGVTLSSGLGGALQMIQAGQLRESGCTVGSADNVTIIGSGYTVAANSYSAHRQSRVAISSGTSLTPDIANYYTFAHTVPSGTAFTMNGPSAQALDGWNPWEFVLYLHNQSASPVTITWGNWYADVSLQTSTVTAGRTHVMTFRRAGFSSGNGNGVGTPKWTLVSIAQNLQNVANV